SAGKEQMGLRVLAPLEDREYRHLLEEIARHLVELGLARGWDHHSEVLGAALKLRLYGERLGFLVGIPGNERLLPRLLHVLVLGSEITTRRVGRRRSNQADDHDG